MEWWKSLRGLRRASADLIVLLWCLFAAKSNAADATAVERGAYLARAGNCISCHTIPDGRPFAGGVAFETDFGTIYSTNITPDAETGIGRWSQADFVAAMRRGVRPNGEHLYPAFPYTAYALSTDADLADLFAYFRSIDPVAQVAPANEMRFPFGFRPLLGLWKALFLNDRPVAPALTASDPQLRRGAYLVEALGHCSACHSPRGWLGNERDDQRFAGGEYRHPVAGVGTLPWSAPNLTAAPRGLAAWAEEDIAAYLATGRNGFIETFGPMNEVVMNSTRYLTNADHRAMARYLKSLPARAEPEATTPDAQLLGRGRTVYNLHCGTCHLPTGLGDPEMGPRLAAGSLVVQDANPASMLNAILYAPEGPHSRWPDAGLPPWRNPMDAFQYLLDDDEVAAVATFIRTSWGNRAGAVSEAQVRRQRPETY